MDLALGGLDGPIYVAYDGRVFGFMGHCVVDLSLSLMRQCLVELRLGLIGTHTLIWAWVCWTVPNRVSLGFDA